MRRHNGIDVRSPVRTDAKEVDGTSRRCRADRPSEHCNFTCGLVPGGTEAESGREEKDVAEHAAFSVRPAGTSSEGKRTCLSTGQRAVVGDCPDAGNRVWYVNIGGGITGSVEIINEVGAQGIALRIAVNRIGPKGVGKVSKPICGQAGKKIRAEIVATRARAPETVPIRVRQFDGDGGVRSDYQGGS